MNHKDSLTFTKEVLELPSNENNQLQTSKSNTIGQKNEPSLDTYMKKCQDSFSHQDLYSRCEEQDEDE